MSMGIHNEWNPELGILAGRHSCSFTLDFINEMNLDGECPKIGWAEEGRAGWGTVMYHTRRHIHYRKIM